MTAQKSWRRRSASVLATATAVLLAASGALLAPAAANAEEPAVAATPTVTVSKTTDLNRDGETVTVTGSGFLPSAPATSGTRPPLAGKFTGAYVAFGYFAEVWQPSTGAPATARKTFTTKWAVEAADMQTIGGDAAGAIEVRPDGTFETTLTVSEQDVSALAAGNYGIYTYPGGGAKYAPFETYTPITFAPETVPADVAPSVASATTAGLTVKTELSNISHPMGAYVAVIEAGTSAEIDQDNMGVGFQWVQPSNFVGGAATSTIEVPAAKLDRAKSYEVLVWNAHSMPTADTILGLASLAVSPTQWEAVFPTAPVVKPSLAATVAAEANVGLKVTAKLADVTSNTGAYIAVIEAGTAAELTAENMGLAADWITPAKFTNGAATATLSVPKAKLDRTKSYEIVSWKAHTNPTLDSLYGTVKLNVTAAQWNSVFPTVAPKIPFTDVQAGDKFYKEISWMYTSKLSTGIQQPNGTVTYAPKANVSREAMAAFLFRQHAPANYKAPAKSPFTDVQTTDKFYKEIAWMKTAGISTGIKQSNGTFTYQPKSSISREAMAAFMYRLDEGKKPAAPKVSPFADMQPSSKFYKEVAWMKTSGLSTGIKQPSGKPTYAPKSNVTREAMAAFLYRAVK
ncbi:S-layer family protein [Leucobacter luti]|uniref:S-layer homology domain-containing protein n=1 Tax=Leucobacter luti TaxID=340320 RepID=UPI001053C22E|nr:S-layer homology domain-containing protein [Leucobacter luti]MCW2288789.1 hypothetical protein [Leucobacter luti]TCK45059.1 S-layer family protein [Leucobacter luti]